MSASPTEIEYPTYWQRFGQSHPTRLGWRWVVWPALGVSCLAGCDPTSRPTSRQVVLAPPSAPAPASPSTTGSSSAAAFNVNLPPRDGEARYPITGVVRQVDRERGKIVARHDAIPGFMDVMTMPFELTNPEELEEVRPNDEFEAELVVIYKNGQVADYRLEGFVVTRFAPNTLTVSTKEGQLRVNQPAEEPPPPPRLLQVGEEAPEFVVTTQEGETLKLSDLRGNAVALTFIYTRCPLPNYCPKMNFRFREVAKLLEAAPKRAERIRLLSVSFDPARDDPATLAAFAKSIGARPPLWTFAVADHAELARVAPRFGLIYGPGRDEVIHNLCTVILDPQGRVVRLDVGSENDDRTATQMLGDLTRALRADNRHPPAIHGGEAGDTNAKASREEPLAHPEQPLDPSKAGS